MATLAVRVVAEKSESVSSTNASRETHTGAAAQALVAPSEIEACLATRNSADGAEATSAGDREQSGSGASSQSMGSMAERGKGSDEQSDEGNRDSVGGRCSQDSSTSESSVKSKVSSFGGDSRKFVKEDSNSSSNSTLKANDEEDSRSSTSSSKTVKTSQAVNEESDDENNSRSSIKSSSRRSSPEKQSQSQSTVKSRSADNDLSDGDSRDSSVSSHSRSTKASSQIVNDKSDDESNSRSSFKSSSKRSSPKKQSQSQSPAKSSQNNVKDLLNDDSRSSFTSSHSKSTKASSQVVNDKSDDESNSRSSFKSISRRSSPGKQSQSQSPAKSSQSTVKDLSDDDSRPSFTSSHSKSTKASSQVVNDKSDNESNCSSSFKSLSRTNSPEKQSQSQSITKPSENDDLLEDNDTRSSFTNSLSISTKKNNQPLIDKSDDESNSTSFKLNINKSTAVKENNNGEQKKKYFSIVDSDSDDDIIVPRKSNLSKIDNDSDSAISDVNKKSKAKKSKNKKNVFDSDSDEDSVKQDKKLKKKKAHSDRSDSSSDEDKGNSNSMNKSNKLSNLIDSESESDSGKQHSEPENVSGGEENDAERPKKGKKTTEKKRTGTARASKDAAMQQIHSETQRLIRESQLSLPYHRPKQRTLQEFLNRKKINTSIPEIPKNLTSAEKVKMFPEMISKVVEEKEKEAEIFYQSSDSEEDENTEEPMEVDESNKDNEMNTADTNKAEIANAINISDTQKLTQDCIQESHNKREILQQRSLDFGVPRKLFTEDVKDTEDSQSIQIDEFPSNEENADSENLVQQNKKPKEVKTGLRESSVPKKLFATDTEEMEMDVDTPVSVYTSEEKTENINESVETSNADAASTEKKTSLEDSTEDFVLHLPETEASNKPTELPESKETTIEKQDQESIVIGETPFKGHKDAQLETRLLENPDASKNDETEILKDVLDATDKDLTKNDEIIDHSVLRDDFGLPPELDEPVKKLTMKEKLLANALKFRPVIKASPGAVIDFTNNGQIKEGVTKLLDRFARHSAVHARPVDDVSEITVLRTEGSGNDISVIEEILPFKKAIVEDDPQKESKPGEKLKKLREDLKRKIVTARNEEWKQKEDKEKEDEEEEAKCKGDDFYADLPDDEEILEDEESAESEPEEDDVIIVDKRRKKCDFGDEEAEESEDEGAEGINEDEEDEEEEEEEENDDDDDDTEKEEEEEEEKIGDKSKKLKRIIRPFDEDSNQSESSLSNDAVPKQTLERTKTDEDMFASQTSNGSDADGILPFQPRNRCDSDARSTCKTPLPKSNNILSMISPVAQLTCLNTSLDSEKKSASKTSNIDLGAISAMKSPSDKSDQLQSNCHLEKMISLPKKLFEDPPEYVNDDELLAICSGKFTDTQSSGVPVLQTQNGVTDSQLLAICSGAFTSQSLNERKSDSPNPAEGIRDENSQDITLTLDDDEESRSSPNKKSSSAKKSDESMFSNDSKSPVKLPTFSAKAFKNPMEAWLSKAKPKPVDSQKPKEVTDSQLMDICSGEFPSQTIKTKSSEKFVNSKEGQNNLFENNSNAVNDEELLALCSGKFPDTQISGMPSLDIQNGFQERLFDKQSNKVNEDDLLAICSGEFPETPMSGLPSRTTQKKSMPTVPVSPSKDKEDEEDSKAPWTGFTIVSSSEEEGNKAKMSEKKKKILKKKKKKVQKLDLSDDEDDEPKEFSDEEEELDEIGDEDEEQYLDYDSEENEVISVAKKDIKKVATKYLENEAELSESDWGSADEDEEDLDKLEFEEGDAEEIDENKMKNELDKIHMKRVMDEDQREVRMLKELLFDDGDLHSEGAGRERKFKWKNIDNIDDDHLGPREENNIDGVDDEVDTNMEIEIRKMRYEQQKFFEEQEKNLNKQIDDDFSECQLGKLGLKLISMRSSSKSLTEEKTVKSNPPGNNSTVAGNRLVNVINKSVAKTSISFSNMRGSFLARGEETLTRIAKNLPEKNKLSINAVRNRKFVFEHLSPSVSNNADDDEQENDDTPVKDKNDKSRKRKIFSSQTPRSTKKMRVDERTAGKKLF